MTYNTRSKSKDEQSDQHYKFNEKWVDPAGNQTFGCCGQYWPSGTSSGDEVLQILCDECTKTYHDICLVRKFNYSMKAAQN